MPGSLVNEDLPSNYGRVCSVLSGMSIPFVREISLVLVPAGENPLITSSFDI
jgi:hypothetical protein